MKFHPKWGSAWLLGLAGLAYYLCGWVLMPRQSPELVSNIIWPPAGIALAACLLMGTPAMIAVGLANFALATTWHFPLRGAIPTALATAGEAALGAYLLRKVIAPELMFRRLRGVVAFLFLGTIVPTVVAATGCEVLHTFLGLHQWHEMPARIFLWGQADFVGVLMFTPVILAWAHQVDWKFRWTRMLESTAVFAGLIVVCLGAFMNWGGLVNWPSIYAYFIVPFLLWATIRLGQRASFAAAVVVAVFNVWGTFLPGTWLTPNWTWGALVMVAGLQFFHSASVEEQKDTTFEQKRLASVLEETPELVVITDTSGKLQYVNHAGKEIAGLG